MLKLIPSLIGTALLSISLAVSAADYKETSQYSEIVRNSEINAFLKQVFEDNEAYIGQISIEHFKTFSEQQVPRATIISCSDSRVQSNAFHRSPENDLFYVRNIGNQIITSEGSVEYGVRHLHTPVLLVIGHTFCGAIKAALGDYSKLSSAIQRDLDHIHVIKGNDTNNASIENVHSQVNFALRKFKSEVSKKELIVLGAIFDFRDDLKQGHGRLILINLNGEKDPKKIKNSIYLKNVKAIVGP